jgi:predicted N-acetyltransferase YhbS
MDELFDLSSPQEDNAEDVAVRCDRGVSLVPREDRRRQRPDRSVLAVRSGSLVARCSCWETPSHDGTRTGIIGHYQAADRAAGVAVLSRACDLLAAAGCTSAAGPMDGTTWRTYRFIVERGSEPPFFLEPDHPDDWPEHWSSVGFSPLETYTSGVTDRLDGEDPRTSGALAQLSAAGILIRALDPAKLEAELRRIFRLSAVSFSRNVLYSPISEEEFLEDTRALLPVVHPDLVLLAEREGELVGFVLALPDVLQARRGSAVDTVIVKTLAVDPAVSGMGLGGVFVALVQRRARQLGYRRAIHALMHETNASRRISDRYARTFRRYVLLSKGLNGREERRGA